MARFFRLGVVALAVASAGACVSSRAVADELRDKVIAAALTTHVHGVNEDIARSEVGAEGLPILHQLLGDPTFPRRDNVVAFLTYLGDNSSARVLRDFLRNPPASAERAEEDRALLLALHALGEIAARRNSLALRVLLTVTRNQSKGGVLAAAARRAPSPDSMRDDLLEMAVRGLGRSDRRAAEGRLQAIAEGRAIPAPGGRRLGRVARASLKELRSSRRRQRINRPGVYTAPKTNARTLSSSDASGVAAPSSPASGGGAGVVAGVMLHDSALDYANHVAHPSPMTNARLDEILADASIRAGRDDFGGDTPCCVHFHRKGTAGTFGAPGDGLDIVDDDVEMYAVLNQQVARFKVVRLINWCGTAATNYIGCSYIGGYGAVVSRYSDLASEGALWVHEYGHNVGLGHNYSNWQLIMYPLISRNSGLTEAECAQFHSPPAGSNADIVTVGQCVQDNLEEGICGDGIASVGEECDHDDRRGSSCSDLGFDAGSLACNSDCTLDTGGCNVCGNGVREGDEECDGSDLGGANCADYLCAAGRPLCSSACTLDLSACTSCPACDNDGVCEVGESCFDCANDCAQGVGAECGNGVCEVADGEDCVGCPQDCNGEQDGRRRRAFCCGLGGDRPVGCSDWRCRSMGFSCTTQPAVPSCCGDGLCSGPENDDSCGLDCRIAANDSVCGNGSCDPGEDSCSCAADCGPPPVEICNDGRDNDCDGSVDCSDADNCGGSALCLCAPAGAACDSPGDCCSYECEGKLRRKTCR